MRKMKKKRSATVLIVVWGVKRAIMIGICFAILYLQVYLDHLNYQRGKGFDTIQGSEQVELRP
jgi:hypothetical protein